MKLHIRLETPEKALIDKTIDVFPHVAEYFAEDLLKLINKWNGKYQEI